MLSLRRASAHRLQVYLGRWHETPVACKVLLRGSGQQLDFPPAVQIAPSPTASAASSSGEASVVPPGLRECSAAKLAAMTRQVEQLPPRWHKQVEALLERQ